MAFISTLSFKALQNGKNKMWKQVLSCPRLVYAQGLLLLFSILVIDG